MHTWIIIKANFKYIIEYLILRCTYNSISRYIIFVSATYSTIVVKYELRNTMTKRLENY